MPDRPPLSDIDLRTRIAAALRTADRRVAGFIGYDEMADAVIAELGLRRETTYAWRNGRTHPAGTRHATRWERS
jgi:hypothetical protein